MVNSFNNKHLQLLERIHNLLVDNVVCIHEAIALINTLIEYLFK